MQEGHADQHQTTAFVGLAGEHVEHGPGTLFLPAGVIAIGHHPTEAGAYEHERKGLRDRAIPTGAGSAISPAAADPSEPPGRRSFKPQSPRPMSAGRFTFGAMHYQVRAAIHLVGELAEAARGRHFRMAALRQKRTSVTEARGVVSPKRVRKCPGRPHGTLVKKRSAAADLSERATSRLDKILLADQSMNRTES